MPEIRNVAFLKRHDMPGFLDKPFSFSVGMSGFYNIVFLKWIHQSVESQLSFPSYKSLSQIWGAFMLSVQNLPPKLRHVSTPRAKHSPKSEARLCPRAKHSPKSEARLCPPCKSLPQNWGTFLPPVQNIPPKLRHLTSAMRHPARTCDN